jgi:hypothetical protein
MLWVSYRSQATTAAMLGAPCNKRHGSFLIGEMASLDASLPVFGVLPDGAIALASAACLALRLAGVPMTYPTITIGSKPYKIKVKNAPKTVPTGLVASAIAIIKATYSHAINTKYI